MSTPTANPLGAEENSVLAATEKISQMIRAEPQEATPQDQEATETANQEQTEPVFDEATGRYRDPVTNKFTKGPEPETDEAKAEAADAPPKEEGADVGADETTDADEAEDYEELADTVDGLAEQLGMEPEELVSTLKATVKINGEEQQVTLAELRNGYQMEGDYRRKTAEVAEQRREMEDLQSAIQQKREEFSSKLEPMLQQLEQYVTVDEQYLNQLAAEGRSDEYLQYKHAADMRRMELQRAQEAKQQLEKEQTEEHQRKLRDAVADNERLLSQLRPDWSKDPEKGKQAISSVRQYLKSEGFDPRDVDGLFDAKTIVLAEKAMKFDSLQKSKPDKMNKVKAVPRKITKPGPAKAAEDPKKKVRAQNLNRLRQTGKPRDAAPIIKDMLGL